MMGKEYRRCVCIHDGRLLSHEETKHCRCDNTDGSRGRNMLCETVQKKKDKNCDFTQVEYKMKKQQMNKQNKQKQIHRYRQQIVITGGERNGGRAKWVK